jgi:hypothetical protein
MLSGLPSWQLLRSIDFTRQCEWQRAQELARWAIFYRVDGKEDQITLKCAFSGICGQVVLLTL